MHFRPIILHFDSPLFKKKPFALLPYHIPNHIRSPGNYIPLRMLQGK